MQNWKKILLLLIVLTPSFFFLSRAFTGNDAEIEGDKLKISGAGGIEIALNEIDSVAEVKTLPETSGTGGFSLGLVKKGNFIRTSDQKKIRIIKNDDADFIHLFTSMGEVYFNLSSKEESKAILTQIKEKVK